MKSNHVHSLFPNKWENFWTWYLYERAKNKSHQSHFTSAFPAEPCRAHWDPAGAGLRSSIRLLLPQAAARGKNLSMAPSRVPGLCVLTQAKHLLPLVLSCLQPTDKPHTYTRDFTLENNPKLTELWLVCRALSKTPPWHKEICAKDGSATLAVPRSWRPWEIDDSSGGKGTYSLLCPSQARHCSTSRSTNISFACPRNL